MASDVVLEFRDLCYRIDDRWILRHINLSVPVGETIVLLGRSGSGKTTLLKTANALLPPTCGDDVFE
jgi:osmoprotectant transport system ATP-binding protein